MNPATIKDVKISNHYITWFCDGCGYFRDLDKVGLAKLDERTPVPTLGHRVKCQRCEHVGGSVHLSHQPSSNPYPGKVFWTTTPWANGKLNEYEPGSESYNKQEALLRERGRN